jgi:hypothetical protein
MNNVEISALKIGGAQLYRQLALAIRALPLGNLSFKTLISRSIASDGNGFSPVKKSEKLVQSISARCAIFVGDCGNRWTIRRNRPLKVFCFRASKRI